MNAFDLDDWPKIPPNNLNKNCFFSATNIVKSSNKGKYIYLAAMKLHLMEQIHGALVMTLLELLQFLALIIVHHLMLIITKIFILVLIERSNDDINGSVGA